MPELADKLEAANKRRHAARLFSSIAFNKASSEIVELLEQADLIAHKLGLWNEYQKAYRGPGSPIENIVAFLRSHL